MTISAQEVINKFARGERNFAGLDLKEANFSNLNLRGIILIGCNLESANFSGTDLTGADLRNARLNRALLTTAILKGANFEGADLSGANLRDSYIENTVFRKAVLMWAHLCANDLRKADLTDAHLDWSCLIGAQLTEDQKAAVPEKAILAGEEKAGKPGTAGAAGYVGKGTGGGYATSSTTAARGYKEEDVSITRGYKGGEGADEPKYKHESSVFEEHGAPQKKEERFKRELKKDLRGK